MRRVSSFLMIFLLITLFCSFRTLPVKALETIYIRADGSIDPPTAPISTTDNITYTFTDNIFDSIVIQRSNITVDGAGYTLQGSGSEDGFTLEQVDNVTIQDMTISNFYQGIYLEDSFHNTIIGNIFTENRVGLCLIHDSDNNTIQGNTITNGWGGITMEWAAYNTIADNLITGLYGRHAVHLDGTSKYNRFLRNNITTNTRQGVYLEFASAHNIFRNNTIAGSEWNLGVHITGLVRIYQDIDTSNTVDGKPIYFLINRTDEHVPSDAGYVALINCTNMTVEGLDLRNNLEGLLLHSTQNCTIRNNNVTHNGYAIKLGYSSNNHLYHNNFINTNYPSFWGDTDNTWDNGYPSGGNYWTTYEGSDQFSGPYQNETGSDGIGDTPYVLVSHSIYDVDNYPLVKPDIEIAAVHPSRTSVGQGYNVQVNVTVTNLSGSTQSFNVTAHANMTVIGSTMNMTLSMRDSTTIVFAWNTTGFQMGNYTISAEVSSIPGELDFEDNILIAQEEVCVTIPGDVDADFDVDIFDVVLGVNAYGATPSDLNWNARCDLVEPYGQIDIFDIVMICINYGEEYIP